MDFTLSAKADALLVDLRNRLHGAGSLEAILLIGLIDRAAQMVRDTQAYEQAMQMDKSDY